MRLLALLATLVVVTPAFAWNGELVLREDPTTHRKYFVDSEPDSDVALGWTFTAEAAKDVDFDLGATDGAYLLKQVGDGANVVNVLVDAKTGRTIADLDNEKAAHGACWVAGGSGTNHCDIAVHYEASSRLAIVAIDSKWHTAALRLYRLRPSKAGLQLQASADLFAVVTHDSKSRLAREHKREPLFQRDGMSLTYSFRALGSKLVKERKGAFEIDIELDFTASVPKLEDSFSVEGELLNYRVRGKTKSSTLTVELR
jgi:hypothetical protein